MTSLCPLLGTVPSDQAPLGLRERNIAFVLKGAAAIAKMLDGAFCFEAIAVRLVDRIARSPKLVATHAGRTVAAATVDIAAHRPFLLPDLSDAPSFGRVERDGAFIVDAAAPISEKIDGPLSFETISVIFIKLVALDPQLLTRLSARVRGGQACEDSNN